MPPQTQRESATTELISLTSLRGVATWLAAAPLTTIHFGPAGTRRS
jgi:hypothetical protein